jgi:hypothetical protein
MNKTAQNIIAIAFLIFSLAYAFGKIVDCRNMNLAATKTAMTCAENESLDDDDRRHCINNSIDNYIGISLDN